MFSNPPSTFALALKQFRTRSDMTQEMLAERSGVSVRSVSDLERGISRSPRKDTVQLLAEAMQLSVEETALLVALASPAARIGAGGLALSNTDTPLVGRERELSEIRRQLVNPSVRLLTLTGVAGIGKTRLALESASLLHDAYRDGVTIVDLAAITTSRYVLPTIAESLGLREQPAQSWLDAIVGALAERRMLLILDNCEHVIAARNDIARVIEQCPHLTVLATSREKLGIAPEQAMPIPTLATPAALPMTADVTLSEFPAVALFIECARAAQADFAPPPAQMRTIAKICVLLEGIPLAIELAAARVCTLTPRVVLAQLAGGTHPGMLGWLRPTRSRSTSRQQTLRDALAWSYRLLEAREQIVFRRLSVFVAGWTLEAATAICDPHATMSMDGMMGSLIEKSLVLQDITADGAERYRMHFVVRAYGAEVLAERKERLTVERTVAEWYATLAEHLEQDLTGANQAESLQQLIQEYENIRAALQWTREHDAITTGLRIAGSLWWYWENRGYLTEGREWLEGLLALWQPHLATIDDEIVARVYYGASILAILQGDMESGESFGMAALQRMHAPAKRARVLLTLGNLAKRRGASDAALDYYTQGLTIMRELQDMKGLLVALNNLSTSWIERGDLVQGMALLEESLDLKRAIGDRRGVAVSLMNQGEILKMQENFSHARAITQEGLDIFIELGDIQGIAFAYSNLGEIANADGEDAAAILAYTQSLVYAKKMEDRAGMATAAFGLGTTLARHDVPQAVAYLRDCAALYQEIDDINGMVTCALTLAKISFEAGEYQLVQQDIQRIALLLPRASAALQQDVANMLQRTNVHMTPSPTSD